jgi:hypothetical protein
MTPTPADRTVRSLRALPLLVALAAAPVAGTGGLEGWPDVPLGPGDGELDPSFRPATGHRVVYGAPGSFGGASVLLAPDGDYVTFGLLRSGGEDLLHWRRHDELASAPACEVPLSAHLPGAGDFALAAARFDTEGRLVLAGTATPLPGPPMPVEAFLARFAYPGCTLDDTLGGDGVVAWEIPGSIGTSIEVADLAVVRYPTIVPGVFADRCLLGFGDRVAAFHEDGTLDTGFASEGPTPGVLELPVDSPSDSALVRALASDRANRLLVGVRYFDASAATYRLRLVRLSRDGDSVLSSAEAAPGAGLALREVTAVAAAPSGRGLVVGYGAGGGSTVPLALETDGAGELAWSAGFESALGASAGFYAAAGQGNGRWIAVGARPGAISIDGFAVRIEPGGFLDAGFGGANRVAEIAIDQGGDGRDAALGVALHAGRPVVCGLARRADAGDDAFLVRLTSSYLFADGFELGSTAGWPGL